MAKRNGEKRNESVAVAIDKDKGSQHALKWAVDHLISRGQSITLLHVKTKPSSIPTPSMPIYISLLLVYIARERDINACMQVGAT